MISGIIEVEAEGRGDNTLRLSPSPHKCLYYSIILCCSCHCCCGIVNMAHSRLGTVTTFFHQKMFINPSRTIIYASQENKRQIALENHPWLMIS